MQKDFRNTCVEFSEAENREKECPSHLDNVLNPEEDFIVRDSAGAGQISSSGLFIFKCSFNANLWNQRDRLSLSADLSSPENYQERVRLIPEYDVGIPSTSSVHS